MSAETELLRQEVDALRARLDELTRLRDAPGLTVAEADDEPIPSGLLDVVVCRLDVGRIGVPLSIVDEVVMLAATTRLPDAPPWVVGLLDLRGTMVPVIDVDARIARCSSSPQLTDQIVVVRAFGGRVGLLVEEVERVAVLPRNGGASALEVPHAAYVREVLRDEFGPILLVGIRRLVTHTEVSVDPIVPP